MAGTSRWWGPRSQFSWEEDALAYVRDLLPDAEPYRAWHTFTFTAASGHVREVDLFVATPSGLYLVEIKSHPGVATNSGSTWMFEHERFRSFENPRHLTNLKCKELRGQLDWAARELGLTGVKIPWIEPAVFLSAPNLRCRFDDTQRIGVYGRDDRTGQTGLPGIGAGVLGTTSGATSGTTSGTAGRDAPRTVPRAPRNALRGRLDPRFSRQLGTLLDKVGIQGLRKHRRIGPYELGPRSFDAGPTWEDYLADNTALPGDPPRRIRLYLSELGAGKDDRESTRRAARREYLALQGIQHPGIVTAESFSDEHEAGPAVVFRHDPRWQRLDLYMAEHGERLDPETRVEMVRQIAEALDHAHRRHLYHRALAARSVYVEQDGHYPRLRIADWQVAARPGGSSPPTVNGPTAAGRQSLVAHIEGSAAGYLAPEFGNVDADGIPLDVFGLGALAYLVLTGAPPADSRAELERRLAERGFLVPSAAVDGISPAADDLVRGATGQQPCDRHETVREFLDWLELLEQDVYPADEDDAVDPLDVGIGAVVAGWRVDRILGTGSTARALRVTRDGHCRVLKVALNADAGRRLAGEAGCLAKLGDSRVVRLIDGPVEAPGRTYIVLEEAGERTLGEHLRREGKLTIDELENYGEDLLRAVEYLEEQDVWHRDIKPDNLAIRRTAKKKRSRLVLFDFSLAGAPETATRVGTQPYLDPFLGADRRPRYDGGAERYAVAVTLHEMASGELPSWGDGVTEPRLQDEAVPQLAEDSFDPSLREGLVVFFQRALHRDARQRYESLRAMRRAWEDVFRGLTESRPPTTPHTAHDEPSDAKAARDAAAEAATAETTLEAAGLSPRAQSVAERDLQVTTVGELMRKPATQIQRLRGVGLGVRNELVRRARQWRRRLDVAEVASTPPAARLATGGDEPEALGLEEVVDRLVPRDIGRNSTEVAVVRLALALPDGDGRSSPVSPWAAQREIAEELGLSQPYVATLLSRARDRWARTAAISAVREQLVEVLGEHGRVLEAGQLGRELLARRGSRLADPAARLALAAAAVRAATDAEERRADPRLLMRRRGDRVLVALCQVGDPSVPSDAELLDYAEALGGCADELARRDPLPGAVAVRRDLRAVPAPDGMPELPDTDLVALAAAASANAAATARFELYPRDLPAERALRLAQAASYLYGPGVWPQQLRARVLDRFPELTGLPAPEDLYAVLRGDLGLDVQYADGRLVLPSGTQLSATPSARPSRAGTADDEALDEVWGRLTGARESGGFRAVTVLREEAVGAVAMLAALPGVTAISVSGEFVAALRDNVAARGKPSWATVLAADSAAASPAARTGFARLIGQAWERLEARVRAVETASGAYGTGGVALLHDVTPLARYTGGEETFARLAAVARSAATPPHGLWLLCPMPNPAEGPRMDDVAVGVHGPAEQIVLPRGFTRSARLPEAAGA